MKNLKTIFRVVIAFIVAVFAYINLYQPASDNAGNNANSNVQQAQAGSRQNGRLRISMLDVGQGDAILLQDGSSNIMIDVGNDAKDKIGTGGGRQALIKALDKAGVKQIKTIIVTHHHRDHMGNIMYVRGKYDVNNIYDNGYVNSSNPTSVELDKDLRAGKYHGKALKAGDRVDLGKDYYLEVLAPGDFVDKSLYKRFNNTSLVMMLHYGTFKMLLTGDAEAGVEDLLQQKYGTALKADVLKVGHHGSKTSSIYKFAEKVQPKYALISCGHHDIYNHPNEDVVGRLQHLGAKVYTTYDHGTLTVTTDGKNFNVDMEK